MFILFLTLNSQHHLSYQHQHHPDHVALERWRASSLWPDLRWHHLPTWQLLSKWLRWRRLALPLQPGMARKHLLRGWETSDCTGLTFAFDTSKLWDLGIPDIILLSIFSGAGEFSQVLWLLSHDLWTLEELLPDISDHCGVQGKPFPSFCGKGGTRVFWVFL